MRQKVLKTGNSLAVTIPAQFTRLVGVRAGHTVRSRVDVASGVVSYTFSGSAQLPLLPKRS